MAKGEGHALFIRSSLLLGVSITLRCICGLEVSVCCPMSSFWGGRKPELLQGGMVWDYASFSPQVMWFCDATLTRTSTLILQLWYGDLE